MDRSRLFRATHALCIVLLAAVAFWYGWSQWQERSASAFFYQNEYSPAVVFACTGEMRAIAGTPSQAVQDFLGFRRTTLECNDALPLPDSAFLSDLNVLQQQTIASNYLFGWLWRIGGIDWNVGGWVAGLFAALAMAGFALVAGLLIPWPVALPVAAAIFFLDDAFREQIIHLRDFSKAAFFYLLLFMTVAMFEAGRWRKPVLAGVAALMLATAVGFRNDASPFLYLFVVALILAVAAHRELRWSLAAAAALTVTLAVYPLLIFDSWQASGTNIYHFYLLGQTLPFVELMELDPSPYLPGYFYNDSMTSLALGLYESARGLAAPVLGTPPYDEAGRHAVLLTTYQFPADSAAKTLTGFGLALFGWIPGPLLTEILAVLFSFSVILFYWRWRGLVLLVPVACYAAITFIQYDLRHVFPYQMLGKLLLAAALALPILHLLALAAGRITGRGLRPWPTAGFARRLVWAAAPTLILLLAVVFIVVMRPWQAGSWRDIRTALDAMPERGRLEPDALVPASASGRAALPLNLPSGIQMRYARLTFDTQGECSGAPVFTLRYETENAFFQWTDRLDFLPQRTGAVYLPLLQANENQLAALEFSARSARCFRSFAEIDLPPGIFPGMYWTRAEGAIERPWYRTEFEDEIARIVTGGVEKYRDLTCLPSSEIITAQAGPVNVAYDFLLGDVVELQVGEATESYMSDHVNLIDPRLIIDNTAISLLDLDIVRSNVPFFTVEYGQTIEKKPLTLRGVEYPDGFGLHAPAMFRLSIPEDLRGKQARIEMLAGIDDETNGLGSATVTVCYSR